MKLNFRATRPGDSEAIIGLLQQVFGVQHDAAFLNPSLMHWKYWQPRADWTEPRSYVLESGGAVIAHAGIVPLVIGRGMDKLRGIQMIDWAALREPAGAGVALMRRLAAQFDFVYSIGGSDITRTILPRCGFIEHMQVWRGARPLRPLAQMLTHQNRNYKLLLRLIRNSFWATFPINDRFAGWKIHEIAPSQVDDAWLTTTAEQGWFGIRSRAFFEYYLQCPTVKFRLYQVVNEQCLHGYFVIGVVRGQARIAGACLIAPKATAWRPVYSLAQRVARGNKESNEVAAAGTVRVSDEAARQSGLRRSAVLPVYLLSRKNNIDFPKDFQFQLWDDDAAFLDYGRCEYWT